MTKTCDGFIEETVGDTDIYGEIAGEEQRVVLQDEEIVGVTEIEILGEELGDDGSISVGFVKEIGCGYLEVGSTEIDEEIVGLGVNDAEIL